MPCPTSHIWQMGQMTHTHLISMLVFVERYSFGKEWAPMTDLCWVPTMSQPITWSNPIFITTWKVQMLFQLFPGSFWHWPGVLASLQAFGDSASPMHESTQLGTEAMAVSPTTWKTEVWRHSKIWKRGHWHPSRAPEDMQALLLPTGLGGLSIHQAFPHPQISVLSPVIYLHHPGGKRPYSPGLC